jgi:hypothetical protein
VGTHHRLRSVACPRRPPEEAAAGIDLDSSRMAAKGSTGCMLELSCACASSKRRRDKRETAERCASGLRDAKQTPVASPLLRCTWPPLPGDRRRRHRIESSMREGSREPRAPRASIIPEAVRVGEPSRVGPRLRNPAPSCEKLSAAQRRGFHARHGPGHPGCSISASDAAAASAAATAQPRACWGAGTASRTAGRSAARTTAPCRGCRSLADLRVWGWRARGRGASGPWAQGRVARSPRVLPCAAAPRRRRPAASLRCSSSLGAWTCHASSPAPGSFRSAARSASRRQQQARTGCTALLSRRAGKAAAAHGAAWRHLRLPAQAVARA